MTSEIYTETGFVYHIKNSYFEIANDDSLMRNHEGGAYRPTYMCVKDDNKDLFWAIPMSRRIEKYKRIIEKDIREYGKCVKILTARYGEKENAFLFQNMFPIIAGYIDYIHTIAGTPAPLNKRVAQKVNQMFKECMRLHKQGVKIIFTDIDRLEKLMRNELRQL